MAICFGKRGCVSRYVVHRELDTLKMFKLLCGKIGDEGSVCFRADHRRNWKECILAIGCIGILRSSTRTTEGTGELDLPSTCNASLERVHELKITPTSVKYRIFWMARNGLFFTFT